MKRSRATSLYCINRPVTGDYALAPVQEAKIIEAIFGPGDDISDALRRQAFDLVQHFTPERPPVLFPAVTSVYGWGRPQLHVLLDLIHWIKTTTAVRVYDTMNLVFRDWDPDGDIDENDERSLTAIRLIEIACAAPLMWNHGDNLDWAGMGRLPVAWPVQPNEVGFPTGAARVPATPAPKAFSKRTTIFACGQPTGLNSEKREFEVYVEDRHDPSMRCVTLATNVGTHHERHLVIYNDDLKGFLAAMADLAATPFGTLVADDEEAA